MGAGDAAGSALDPVLGGVPWHLSVLRPRGTHAPRGRRPDRAG
jgi:hypothetical protein